MADFHKYKFYYSNPQYAEGYERIFGNEKNKKNVKVSRLDGASRNETPTRTSQKDDEKEQNDEIYENVEVKRGRDGKKIHETRRRRAVPKTDRKTKTTG